MNELMLFNNNEFGELRGKLLEDLCWFVGRDAIKDLGYTPSVTLEEGVRKTASWYKSNKWL